MYKNTGLDFKLRRSGIVYTLDFSPDGEQILIGQAAEDSLAVMLAIWGRDEQKLKQVIEQDAATVPARFSPDGDYVSYIQLLRVKCFDVTKRRSDTLNIETSAKTMWLQYGDSGNFITTAGTNVFVWDTVQDNAVWELDQPLGSPGPFYKSVSALDPANSMVAVSSIKGGTIHIYNFATGDIINTIDDTPPYPRAISFVPNSSLLAVMSNQFIQVFDWKTGDRIRGDGTDTPYGVLFSMRVHPQGKYIAMGLASGFVIIIDVETGKRLVMASAIENEDDSRVHDLAFSPDGQQLWIGGGDGKVVIWEYAQ